MKQILFYTDTPHYGGAEKQMEWLAKYLPDWGYEVSLACGSYSALAKRRTEPEAIYKKTYVIPTFHKHDPWHYFGLKCLFKNKRFDAIHLHLWNPGSCRYAFWAASHTNTPIVTTEHDPFLLDGLKGWIKKKCLNKTDQMIVISVDNFGQLSDYNKDVKNRLNIVHNGIELNCFVDNKDKASLDVESGDFVMICVAELHPRKGHSYLIEAFKRLSDQFPRLHLMLVGKGPIENELQRKYGDLNRLHFLGWREDVPALLKASDLLVLPSLNEAFGLVLLEAMASGVAVIGTNSGGIKDIIEHEKSGLLAPPADSEGLAEAIRMVLLNPEKKRQMEWEALERVKQFFTANEMARLTSIVYNKVIKK